MHKSGVPTVGTELGREILMQLGTLQLYGMDPQLTPMERGLVKYSLLMDKSGLMDAHMRFMKQFGELERDWQLTKDAAAVSKGSGVEARPPVRKKAVEGMRAIRLVELKVGKRNHGRVLYATICADTFFLSLIQTLVEDDEGHAARVMIDDATLDGSASWAKAQRRYPKGAKVAIKAPFLSDLPDESIALYVNSEEDLVVLSDSSPYVAEVDPWEGVDVASLRAEGNRLFSKGDWPGAIEFYTKCIQKATSSNQRKIPGSKNKKRGHSESNGLTSNGKVSTETVMLAYSNRAAAWMKLSHYERALADAGEALHLDPQHLKSIYRKGCALHQMQQFEQARDCFAMALEHAPEKEIKLAHERSSVCDQQSRLGVYDIHKYLLDDYDGSTPPEYSDYVGPVEIKLMEGKGKRGLFVTRDVEVGELLLVSNALAVVHAEGRRMFTSSGRSNATLRDELVFKLSNLVLKSSKWLQQMCNLADCDCHGNGKVPSLELFRPNSKWNSSKDDVPLARIKGVVLQNALGESGSCARALVAGQQPPMRQFLGLWPLPSFINHSCASNSFRLHVGDTLFLHASRPIEAGEEVTLAYVNTLLPRQMRHDLLDKDSWEFKCNCSRCELETNLCAPLKQVSRRFQSLWGYKESVTPGQAESFKMAKLALNLEHILKNVGLYLYEIQLIRASFFIMYWIGYLNLDRLGDLAKRLPLPENLIDAMTTATPGDPMSLFFAGFWLKKFQEQGANGAVIDDAQKRAMHICRCIYGKQKSEVLKRLVKAHDVTINV
ncbi:hypothetical protein KC19_VG296300 [Ceratodon purpureus]|uniref:SET domain-containing protein n=1 Tax=Ceratodon purpureus TaxID=3225 RepID=A0A8T0HVY3_CERPU|nr:hypothetical protein KC19_VG296300 [Ceratodon purpureus]